MSSAPSRRVSEHNHASGLPEEFWAALRKNEPAANIILPFAQKALDFPREDSSDQLWIVVYNDTANDVEFVLSCTKGSLGNYPIFIYTPNPSARFIQEEEELANSLLHLVLCLLKRVPPQRVFSVFSIAKVAQKFAEIFEKHTCQQHGIRALEDPYYDATFTFCTSETLNKPSVSFSSLSESGDFLIALRRADISNLDGIKILCKAFSNTSTHYMLDDERAELEAKALITDHQVWVHMIKKGSEEWEAACLVAITRESENVSAITKVFTAERWRGYGCAPRLLHRVCLEMSRKNKSVVLYVGNSTELAAARRLYHKIGFQGLDAQQEQTVENVERWVEIGFEGTHLGYW